MWCWIRTRESHADLHLFPWVMVCRLWCVGVVDCTNRDRGEKASCPWFRIGSDQIVCFTLCDADDSFDKALRYLNNHKIEDGSVLIVQKVGFV